MGFISNYFLVLINKRTPVIYLPLFLIVVITAIKDALEDLKRHKSDKEENNRKT